MGTIVDSVHSDHFHQLWLDNMPQFLVGKGPCNKLLFTIERDPALVERYRDDPAGTVTWWEAEEANRILNCTTDEQSTWLAFTDEERDVLGPTWCPWPTASTTPWLRRSGCRESRPGPR